jgi:hypothetical protein
MTVNPIAAATLAAVLVGEPVTLNLVVGLVAVFSGIWIAHIVRPRLGRSGPPLKSAKAASNPLLTMTGVAAEQAAQGSIARRSPGEMMRHERKFVEFAGPISNMLARSGYRGGRDAAGRPACGRRSEPRDH